MLRVLPWVLFAASLIVNALFIGGKNRLSRGEFANLRKCQCLVVQRKAAQALLARQVIKGRHPVLDRTGADQRPGSHETINQWPNPLPRLG